MSFLKNTFFLPLPSPTISDMFSTFNSIPPCLAGYPRAGIIRKARKSLIFLVFLSQGSKEECELGKLSVQFFGQLDHAVLVSSPG